MCKNSCITLKYLAPQRRLNDLIFSVYEVVLRRQLHGNVSAPEVTQVLEAGASATYQTTITCACWTRPFVTISERSLFPKVRPSICLFVAFVGRGLKTAPWRRPATPFSRRPPPNSLIGSFRWAFQRSQTEQEVTEREKEKERESFVAVERVMDVIFHIVYFGIVSGNRVPSVPCLLVLYPPPGAHHRPPPEL